MEHFNRTWQKSIIVNVPGTYLPEPIDGIMITGLLTPSPDSDFTYPKNLKDKLIEGKLGKYELEQVGVDDIPKYLLARHSPEKLVEQANNLIRSHGEVMINLMKNYEWEFAMVVFRNTDDVQHLLWGKENMILSCYGKADEYLGKMMNLFPESTIIVVSDHGFQKAEKYFYVNNFLYNHGFIKTKTFPTPSTSNILLSTFIKTSAILFRLLPLQKILRTSIGKKLVLSSGTGSIIDISRTTAFYHSICSRGIRINLKEKYEWGAVNQSDYEKIRKELIKLLAELRDPENGKKVVKRIYTWEEIYGKDARNDPLDLIIELGDGYGGRNSFVFQIVQRIDLSTKKANFRFWRRRAFMTG